MECRIIQQERLRYWRVFDMQNRYVQGDFGTVEAAADWAVQNGYTVVEAKDRLNNPVTIKWRKQ